MTSHGYITLYNLYNWYILILSERKAAKPGCKHGFTVHWVHWSAMLSLHPECAMPRDVCQCLPSSIGNVAAPNHDQIARQGQNQPWVVANSTTNGAAIAKPVDLWQDMHTGRVRTRLRCKHKGWPSPSTLEQNRAPEQSGVRPRHWTKFLGTLAAKIAKVACMSRMSYGCRMAVVWLSYGCRASMCHTVDVSSLLLWFCRMIQMFKRSLQGQQGALSGEWNISAFPKPPVCFVHWRRTLASTWTRPDKLRPARVCVPLTRLWKKMHTCSAHCHLDTVFV